MTYTDDERLRAAAWKSWSTTLPDAARAPAPYMSKTGTTGGRAYDFCLPPEHAALSLLPEVRDDALALFAELGIPWHAGVDGGPSNHLLSSQVQCVNALGQMVRDPDRLRRAFGPLLDTAEVLQVEPGRFLTFEYIGDTDHFDEGKGRPRVRGAHSTSVDAAFLHRTTAGVVELVLVEWKYTESYGRRKDEPSKDAVRWRRYGAAWCDPEGPVTTELAFADALQEPLYQLVRQQLLARALEQEHAHGADVVRVLHVSPPGNAAYASSLQPAQRALGETVHEVWQRLLRQPDRFRSVDSALFLDEEITSDEYVIRYSPDVVHSTADLLRVAGVVREEDVEDVLYAEASYDGEVTLHEHGLDLSFCGESASLGYPQTWRALSAAAGELQSRVESR